MTSAPHYAGGAGADHAAAGERFIVAGDFLWLHEAAAVLREEQRVLGVTLRTPRETLKDTAEYLLSA